MTTQVATSWSGSEAQRRPQGTCSANGYKPNLSPRFYIGEGTLIQWKPIADPNAEWKWRSCRHELKFHRYESDDGPQHVIFRLEGYWIRISRHRLLDRYPQGRPHV